MESKESIGGYGVFDVPDLDAAIEVAKTWPAPGHRIEIRPVVER
ncbi:MAG: YciI family protein [Candidatus Dormibacteraeota bacterium]|nr:YciI family protein [Candidatus Dormibacteraeota bacterium]